MSSLVSRLAFLSCFALSASSLTLHSDFVGNKLKLFISQNVNVKRQTLVMRKQKASDKRTSRLQKGLTEISSLSSISNESSKPAFPHLGAITASPMATATWDYKSIDPMISSTKDTAGRGRARKRAQVYSGLAAYHSEFLNLLTAEYRAEVSNSIAS